MPYEIKKFNKGFKVCKKTGDKKCFSNNPIPLKNAIKQRKAISINEGLYGGSFEIKDYEGSLSDVFSDAPSYSVDFLEEFFKNICDKGELLAGFIDTRISENYDEEIFNIISKLNEGGYTEKSLKKDFKKYWKLYQKKDEEATKFLKALLVDGWERLILALSKRDLSSKWCVNKDTNQTGNYMNPIRKYFIYGYVFQNTGKNIQLRALALSNISSKALEIEYLCGAGGTYLILDYLKNIIDGKTDGKRLLIDLTGLESLELVSAAWYRTVQWYNQQGMMMPTYTRDNIEEKLQVVLESSFEINQLKDILENDEDFSLLDEITQLSQAGGDRIYVNKNNKIYKKLVDSNIHNLIINAAKKIVDEYEKQNPNGEESENVYSSSEEDKTGKGKLNDNEEEYLNLSTKKHRQSLGQFMTPRKDVDKAFETIAVNVNDRILEPSCGTGNYLQGFLERGYKDITGVEFDTTLYNEFKDKFEAEGIKTINGDYLLTEFDEKFDLIVGNPPYFIYGSEGHPPMPSEVREKYKSYFSGNVDIYGLFIIKGLMDLKDGGLISYYIPSTILNAKTFTKMRAYIHKHASITRCEPVREKGFKETKVNNLMMFQIVKTNKPNNDFTTKVGGELIFSFDKEPSGRLYQQGDVKRVKDFAKFRNGTVPLEKVKKDELTNTPIPNAVPLVYTHNLKKNNTLDLNVSLPEHKKQYILKNKYKAKPFQAHLLVTKRVGVRAGTPFVLLEEGEYYLENHTLITTGTLENLRKVEKVLNKPDYKEEYLGLIKGISWTAGFIEELPIDEDEFKAEVEEEEFVPTEDDYLDEEEYMKLIGEGRNIDTETFKNYLKRFKITTDNYLYNAKIKAKNAGYNPDKLFYAHDGVHKLEYHSREGNIKFGRVGYKDYIIYKFIAYFEKDLRKKKELEKEAEKFRDRFIKSHKAISKKHQLGNLSPNELAIKILW